MKKKIYTLLIAALLLLGSMSLTDARISYCSDMQNSSVLGNTETENIYTCNDYIYSISDDGGAAIEKYIGSGTNISIPEQINNLNVTAVNSYAFINLPSLKEVVIPDCITQIGENAFGYIETETGYDKVENFTIRAYPDTIGHTYAQNNGFNFNPLYIPMKSLTITFLSSDTVNEYSGSAIRPAFSVSFGDVQLKAGTDYSTEYTDNLNAGTACVTITGKGRYSGTLTKKFKIAPKSIKGSKISGVKTSYTYTGNPIKPTIKLTLGKRTLSAKKDYTVTYSSNKNTGTATVTIKGKGNYTGNIKKNFKITKKSILKAKVTNYKKTYTYSAKKIKPVIKVRLGKLYLKNNTDYTLRYSGNDKAGTATIIISGKGNYTGKIKRTFKIIPREIKSCRINNLKKCYNYTGKPITPSFALTYNGKKLVKDRDYTISYKNNQQLGTATVYFKGTGNYTGRIKKSFKIMHLGWTVIDNSKYYYNGTGQKVTGIYLIGSSTYYFDNDGRLSYGWQKIDNKYYFFDRKTGIQKKSGQVDGFTLLEDSSLDTKSADIERIETMMTANRIANEITSPDDTIEEKRLKCFKWVFPYPYYRFRKLQPIYKTDGWEVTFANDIFKNKKGCCVSVASAVAFMFHEIGYDEVYVAHDTSHSWIELEGRIYDPLFAEARSFEENYNAYSTKDYRIHPVGKHKI